MRINTNIPSLILQRQIKQTSAAIARSLERLSSGKRINSARDDASGLAIANGLTSQIRAMSRAVKNINDSAAVLQTAEGALHSQMSLVQRMRELALQAANGTLSSQNRNALKLEFDQLYEEFNRLTRQTEFNGVKLLDGTFNTKTIQLGSSQNNTVELGLSSTQASQVFTQLGYAGSLQSRERYVVPFEYTTTRQVTSTTPGDFNEDGILDIVTISNSYFDDGGDGFYSYQAHFWMGGGDGTFTLERTSEIDSSPSASGIHYTVMDYNEDGFMDLVAQNQSQATSVFLGDGQGGFTELANQTGASGTSFADFNGDGHLDRLSLGTFTESVLYLGDGQGNFSFSATITSGGFATYHTASGDLNGDGKLDAIISDLTNTYIALGDGTGGFGAAVALGAVIAPTVKDLNGDGKLDLFSGSGNDVHVRYGNGDGTFQSAITTTLSYAKAGANHRLVDMNNDGYQDFVTGQTGNTIGIYLGRADGTFSFSTSSASLGSASSLVYAEDVDGDGVTDIITGDHATSTNNGRSFSIFRSNTISVSAISDLGISTQDEASTSLRILDNALLNLNDRLSNAGAQWNRLQYAANNASLTKESLEQARSYIEDTDFAEETAELTRQNILQQAQLATLTQANTSLEIVLALFRPF